MNVRTVDAHVHVADIPLTDATGAPVRADCERLLAAMRDEGVEQAVLVQPSAYGLDHTYLLDWLDRCPDIFAGIALVHPDHADRLRQLLAGNGPNRVVGIRLTPLIAPNLDWFGPGTDWAMRVAADHRLVVSVLLHPRQLPSATAWIQGHPDVAIVIDHLARPDLADSIRQHTAALLRLARHPNAYMRVSALQQLSAKTGSYDSLRSVTRAVLDAWGHERIMWGSDFPYLRPGGYHASLEALDRVLPNLPAGARGDLLGSNARRLFRLPQPTRSEGMTPPAEGRAS